MPGIFCKQYSAGDDGSTTGRNNNAIVVTRVKTVAVVVPVPPPTVFMLGFLGTTLGDVAFKWVTVPLESVFGVAVSAFTWLLFLLLANS